MGERQDNAIHRNPVCIVVDRAKANPGKFAWRVGRTAGRVANDDADRRVG
jgi:hypothetical protein